MQFSRWLKIAQVGYHHEEKWDKEITLPYVPGTYGNIW